MTVLLKLHKLIKDLGVVAVGTSTDAAENRYVYGGYSIDFDHNPTTSEKNQVKAIIDAFDDTDYAATRKSQASGVFSDISQLRTVTPTQIENYINNQVTDLASAKEVLVIVGIALVAIRDQLWPDMADD